jgi:hypothetical protein
MSIIKFELKEEHLKLVKHLTWADIEDFTTISTFGGTPFGGLNHHEDMGVILYGQPEDFDPFEGDPFDWTEEQKTEMDKLLIELPLAIEIILNAQTFELGEYKTKFHIREWKLIKK